MSILLFVVYAFQRIIFHMETFYIPRYNTLHATNHHPNPQRLDQINPLYLHISIYLIVIGAVAGAGAFFLLPDYWYLWLVLLLVGMILLVNWHKGETAYCCPNCGHEYTISFLVDLVAPHGVDREGAWLLLKCPSCRERYKTRVLKRVK